MDVFVKCPGCGALVPDGHGLPHPYIGASPGCWDVYGRVLAKEYGEFGYPARTHRLTVDTYSVQHPGNPNRRAIQSVNLHLMSLCLVLEQGIGGLEATRKIEHILKHRRRFEWLEPPSPIGDTTVLDVVVAGNLSEHERLVEAWARNVWEAWAFHHARIRKMLEM